MSERRERKFPDKFGIMFLVCHNGKVLVEERIRPDSTNWGFYLIPAGGIETGEDPEKTMLREAGEEHGIKPTQYYKLPTFENVSLRGDFYQITPFLITRYEGEVVNKESEKCNLHWMTFEEAMAIVPLASSKLVLYQAQEVLSR